MPDGNKLDLLTIEELAEQLRVPTSWIYARTRRRGPEGIPVMRLGKYLRFSLPDVLEWAKKQADE